MTQSPANEPEPIADDLGHAFSLPVRAAALLFLLVVAVALGCRLLDAEQASAAAFKVVTATLAIGVVPGALVTLCWRPRPHLSVLELVGFGIAISFGLVHLLTMFAISAHVSPVSVLVGLILASLLMSAFLCLRASGHVVVSLDELIVIALLFVLGVPLYLQGSPVSSYEDQILVAIMRRVSELARPGFDNLYVAPGIVYVYVFPSVHYFMGLVARLGDIDPLFLYHKLRFFWSPAAMVMLYLTARAVFGRAALACAVAVAAIVLACSGVFAQVPGIASYWGQLTPYSYVPDVSMTVLLPALLVVAFSYLQSGPARERRFFLGATVLLVLMLVVVHIREVVQFAVYVGCFVVATVAFSGLRPYLRRAMVLLALTLAIAVVYNTAWQARMVPVAQAIVSDQRAELLSVAATISTRELVLAPASRVLSESLQYFDPIFDGLTPFFLFAGPVVILLFRRQPLVWLISSSTIAYLALMSVPLLAVPYIYLTYFEILHIPVRNIVFFVYLLAGVVLYIAVVALTRVDRTRMSLPLAGAAGGMLALLTSLGLNQSHQGFFAPMIAAYGLTFLLAWGSPLRRKLGVRNVVAAVVCLLALVALWPERQPVPRSEEVSVRWTSGLPDARRETFERQFSLGQGQPNHGRTEEVNVWNYRLTDFSVDNVRGIVNHPDALDTNDIDRSTFVVPPRPPPADHQTLGVEYVTWLQYPGMTLMAGTALFVWALGLLVPAVLTSKRGSLAASSLETSVSGPFYRRAIPFALFVLPFALVSTTPTLSPLTAAPTLPARADTPRATIAQLPCVTTPPMVARFTEHLFPGEDIILPESTECPPDWALIEWIRAHVPVEAVFAIDRWTPYPPSMFVPQQLVVFPTLDASFIREDNLFKDYYRLFEERMRRYRVQPFFNAVETPAERSAFVEALGVTHVLLNPAHYDEMRPVLDALPDQFALRYSGAQWAVYEVNRRGEGS